MRYKDNYAYPFYFIFAFCIIFSALAAKADDISPQTSNGPGAVVYISNIEIYGELVTRPEVLKRFIVFEAGDPLDTSAIRITRGNLIRTQLFQKVDILTHMREDGAHIFIILKEAVRLSLNYSGQYGTHKYGNDKLWWSVHLNAGLSNFRGQLEELSFGVSFWEYRGLSAYWHKPFLSTPYFIRAGAAISAYPDERLPLDYRDISARMTAGRYIGRYSQISLSAIPVHRNRTLKEKFVIIDDTLVIPLVIGRDIYEAFGVLGVVNDLRSSRFDPQSGWFLRTEISTNRLYYDQTLPFWQLRNEFRYYQPLFFDDMAVLRISATLRDGDAGTYHRLLYGDAGQIRGYNSKALGWRFVANSSVLASVKYHKPVWRAQAARMPLVNTVYSGVNELSYRIDAALIADYARLYNNPQGILHLKGPWQSGTGLGGGIRVVIPEIKISGCADLVYGRRDVKKGSGHEWKPVLHGYLDMFY